MYDTFIIGNVITPVGFVRKLMCLLIGITKITEKVIKEQNFNTVMRPIVNSESLRKIVIAGSGSEIEIMLSLRVSVIKQYILYGTDLTALTLCG